ncbi:uncharacterized protein EAF01_008187 [Botrytis porri]|uniref:uncharacterized protein n=1 Tax=Botrytis porri TaxID=87229 RepID=UPI0019002CF6|nr:uncharacterized protein EAF01_008187 [Botrytis porri]KAF7898974.1 hypothetical protein EAF01_008187 [Botrytis porri]
MRRNYKSLELINLLSSWNFNRKIPFAPTISLNKLVTDYIASVHPKRTLRHNSAAQLIVVYSPKPSKLLSQSPLRDISSTPLRFPCIPRYYRHLNADTHQNINHLLVVRHTILSPQPLSTFGPSKIVRLGDIALARSGDKGANLICWIFIPSSSNPKLCTWLQNHFSRSKMQELLGEEWKEGYVIERVEFPAIMAVHFVIYGYLGRGVSSSSRLDCLGKGFTDYLRDKWVEVPVEFLG